MPSGFALERVVASQAISSGALSQIGLHGLVPRDELGGVGCCGRGSPSACCQRPSRARCRVDLATTAASRSSHSVWWPSRPGLESLRLRTLELVHDRVSAVEANKTLCPVGMVTEVRPAAWLLSALAEAVRAIGTGVLDAVVIENFADAGLGPDRRPPTPVACTSAPRVIQLQASMPWTCCSTSRMLLYVWFPSASKAAPVPRPPQPTSAILISSLPAETRCVQARTRQSWPPPLSP